MTDPVAPPRRLHIVGCPRSGTTLMMELVTTCFRSGGFCEHEMSIYQEPDAVRGLFISKKPTDVRIIAPVLEADPDLYVIYVLRDPRAVISSIHRSHADRYFCNFRIWRECDAAARRLEGHSRFVTVRYEELVENPDAVQDRLCMAMPFLEQLHAFSGYQEYSNASRKSRNAMDGLRPVSGDRAQAWRRSLPRIKGQLQLHPDLADALVLRGYEKDNAWIDDLLRDVTAEFRPSRYREKERFLKRVDFWIRNRAKLARKRRAIRARGS